MYGSFLTVTGVEQDSWLSQSAGSVIHKMLWYVLLFDRLEHFTWQFDCDVWVLSNHDRCWAGHGATVLACVNVFCIQVRLPTGAPTRPWWRRASGGGRRDRWALRWSGGREEFQIYMLGSIYVCWEPHNTLTQQKLSECSTSLQDSDHSLFDKTLLMDSEMSGPTQYQTFL